MPESGGCENKMSTQVGIVRTTYHTMYSLARGHILLFYVVQSYFAVRLRGSPACGKSAVEKQGRPITQSPLEKSGTSKTNEVDILSAYVLDIIRKNIFFGFIHLFYSIIDQLYHIIDRIYG